MLLILGLILAIAIFGPIALILVAGRLWCHRMAKALDPHDPAHKNLMPYILGSGLGLYWSQRRK